MTRRRSGRSIERRLNDLETNQERTHAPLAVSYHPDADEYRDGDGNVVDPAEYDPPLAIVPTDEQIERIVEGGEDVNKYRGPAE
jgi:hypothetical protein